MKNALLGLAAFFLTGCVYVFSPEMGTYYDEECKDVYREMRLTVEQQAFIPIDGCSNEKECLFVLGITALITPASAIVSGSIVVVGNTVFWVEKQGRCYTREHLVSASH